MTAEAQPAPSIAEIEEVGRLTMPPSAGEVEAYVDLQGIDDILIVRFKLSPDELGAFLSEAGYPEPPRPVERLTSIPGWAMGFDGVLPGWPDEDEWRRLLEDPAHTLLAAEVSEADFYRSVVIDTGDPEVYTIYLRHNDL